MIETVDIQPEAVPPAEVDSEAISSVDWWITSRCNLACDFCYGPLPTRDPADVREGIAQALVDSPAETITFCGGEPLVLGEEVFKYARMFKAAGKRVVLNTNGELLEQAVRRFLEPGEELPFDVVGISIDGPTQEEHSLMRQGANLAATFNAARLVKAHNKILKIASVISGVSSSWLPELVGFVRQELNPEVLRLYQYNPNGEYNEGQDRHKLSKEDFEKAVSSLQLEYAAWGMPVYPSDNESQGCMIVDPKGTVSISNKDGYKPLGNCLAEPLGALWARQPESIRSLVQKNKRWIGSTAIGGAMTHDHRAGMTAVHDVYKKPGQKDRSSDLRSVRALLFTRHDVANAIKQSCIRGLPEGLSHADKELYWLHAVDSLLDCSPEDTLGTTRVVDQFLYYINRIAGETCVDVDQG